MRALSDMEVDDVAAAAVPPSPLDVALLELFVEVLSCTTIKVPSSFLGSVSLLNGFGLLDLAMSIMIFVLVLAGRVIDGALGLKLIHFWQADPWHW